MATKDLDEDEFYRLLDEHYKNQPQYRSIDQIKEAVAYEEPNTWRTDESFRERDELRKEILQSLNIEDTDE